MVAPSAVPRTRWQNAGPLADVRSELHFKGTPNEVVRRLPFSFMAWV